MPRMPHASTILRPSEAITLHLGTERDIGAPVMSVVTSQEQFVISTGDGHLVFADGVVMEAQRLAAHAGVILSMAPCRAGVLTGGDDGRVVVTAPGVAPTDVWQAPRGVWIDQVAADRNGAMAWAAERTVTLRRYGASDLKLTHPSTIGGLAFAPKSNRLAVAHYGGVTIWDLSVQPPVQRVLAWKGSHLNVAWSLDEKFIVTAMQESALHGWRVSDAADFQMNGYPSKPRSQSWSRKGDWLATSGATEILLWSFKGAKGPMGTSPVVLSRRTLAVTKVAFHPLNAYVAAGYRDGVILLARQEDSGEFMVRTALGAPISGLAWASDGRRLAYGTEDGRIGIVDFSALEAMKAAGR